MQLSDCPDHTNGLRLMTGCLTAIAFVVVIDASPAAAEIRPPVAGDCSVLVTGVDGAAPPELRIDSKTARVEPANLGGGDWLFPLKAPLQLGETVAVSTEPSQTGIPVRGRRPGAGGIRCAAPVVSTDGRDGLSVRFRYGYLFERFAPQKEGLRKTFSSASAGPRPGETSAVAPSDLESQALQLDLEFRAHGVPDARRPLWFFVNTLYGRRQSAVCLEGTGTATEEDRQACSNDGLPDPSKALVVVRQADTVEMRIGWRWEFLGLGDDTARLYGSCGFGAVFIAGVGDKALSNHGCGAGVTIVNGRFRHTFLEWTHGKSEIFAPDASTWDRNRFELFVSATVFERDFSNIVKHGFARLQPHFRVSLDRGAGPDSFRSFIGLSYDFVSVFSGM